MPGLSAPRFVQFGNHPTVQHATGRDMRGTFWIHCRCVACGPAGDFMKPCSMPMRANSVVATYARMHNH